MKHFTKGAVVLATIPLLLVGMAAAAVAGGSGIMTTRPFSDGSWRPEAKQVSGVSTMRPFSDSNYPIAVRTSSGVTTMRPFSDPDYPIHAQPVARGVRPKSPGPALPLAAVAVSLTALAAAAAAWATIGRRERLRTA